MALESRPDLKAAIQAVDKAKTDHDLAVANGSTDMANAVKLASKLVIPRFASEEAEANWFHRNRRRVKADMTRRMESGETKTLAQALKISAAREKARLKPITIRMLPDDLVLLRRLASEKGLPYQMFVKVLLRDALRRETKTR